MGSIPTNGAADRQARQNLMIAIRQEGREIPKACRTLRLVRSCFTTDEQGRGLRQCELSPTWTRTACQIAYESQLACARPLRPNARNATFLAILRAIPECSLNCITGTEVAGDVSIERGLTGVEGAIAWPRSIIARIRFHLVLIGLD